MILKGFLFYLRGTENPKTFPKYHKNNPFKKSECRLFYSNFIDPQSPDTVPLISVILIILSLICHGLRGSYNKLYGEGIFTGAGKYIEQRLSNDKYYQAFFAVV
jgi:hypothetical protein